MLLPLSKLSATAVRFTGEDPAGVLEWEGFETDIIRPGGPLHWDFKARLFDTEVLIDGFASADFEGICARCAKPIKFTIREPIVFSVEVAPAALTADITSEIREAIILAIPLNPLCREDCPGLCPRCGAPLVNNTCTCAPPAEENPFAKIGL